MSRLIVTFRIAGREQPVTVKGQVAKTLVAMVKAGNTGITALDCDTWAFRLAAYCHKLRHLIGLQIETRRERHPGGNHGRYVLLSPVVIVADSAAELD
jgi:hypothetical protein